MMKTETKHTPGPWFFGDTFTSYICTRDGKEVTNYTARGIGNGACHVGYASITPALGSDEAKANARLIAAAPDLLAACKALHQCLSGWVEIAEAQDRRAYDSEALKMGQDAIRKAEGES